MRILSTIDFPDKVTGDEMEMNYTLPTSIPLVSYVNLLAEHTNPAALTTQDISTVVSRHGSSVGITNVPGVRKDVKGDICTFTPTYGSPVAFRLSYEEVGERILSSVARLGCVAVNYNPATVYSSVAQFNVSGSRVIRTRPPLNANLPNSYGEFHTDSIWHYGTPLHQLPLGIGNQPPVVRAVQVEQVQIVGVAPSHVNVKSFSYASLRSDVTVLDIFPTEYRTGFFTTGQTRCNTVILTWSPPTEYPSPTMMMMQPFVVSNDILFSVLSCGLNLVNGEVVCFGIITSCTIPSAIQPTPDQVDFAIAYY